MFWECVGSLVQCLCALNSTRACNSCSGEPSSPRRDMQGLVSFPARGYRLGGGILGLGKRSSRLGERVSPKRGFERVGDLV